MPAHKVPLEVRFWRHVDRRGPDECWPWTGDSTRDGYGRIRLPYPDRTRVFATRLSWMLAHGAWPTLLVCHTCDNPGCVNPAHLWEGSLGENQRDSVAKGRHRQTRKTHCPHGHPLDGVRSSGVRYCLTCNRLNCARWRAARKPD